MSVAPEIVPVDAEPRGAIAARRLLHLASAVVLGGVWLALVAAWWSLVAAFAVTPLLPAVVGAGAAAVRTAMWVEGFLARRLLDAPVAPRRIAPRRRGYWATVPEVLGDRAVWRGQAFLLLRATLGMATGAVVVAVLGAGLMGVAAPLVYRFLPNPGGANGIDFGFWTADSVQWALLLVPVGLVLLAMGVGLVHLLGRMWRRIAVAVLGGREPVVGEPTMPATPDPISADGLRRGATATAAAAAAVVALLVLIWGLTSRGYFWPVWVILPLALVTAAVAWVAWVLGDPVARTRLSAGVTIAAVIYASVTAFLIGVWLLTRPRYFWPVWPALGLLVVLTIHAGIVCVAVPRPRLQERIDRLTQTRSAAIDAQEAELRRIERDLHDGAQARLVSLGMMIGLAEQRLEADPGGARQLLEEAREGAHEALDELRDLARGIRPPVLQDRGLVAAVRELALRSPLDVDVIADLDRLPPAVESAAYFVVAESLANASKHAAAAHIGVRLARIRDALVVEVVDDGRGGADPDGHGLTGLRHRVEALDGTLRVTSPPAGPTVVLAEVPCAPARNRA